MGFALSFTCPAAIRSAAAARESKSAANHRIQPEAGHRVAHLNALRRLDFGPGFQYARPGLHASCRGQRQCHVIRQLGFQKQIRPVGQHHDVAHARTPDAQPPARFQHVPMAGGRSGAARSAPAPQWEGLLPSVRLKKAGHAPLGILIAAFQARLDSLAARWRPAPYPLRAG